MQIKIISIGKIKQSSPYYALLNFYKTRLEQISKDVAIDFNYQIFPNFHHQNTNITKQKEAKIFKPFLQEKSFHILLDETGLNLTSKAIYKRVFNCADQNKNIYFYIGGSHGVAQNIYLQMNELWSFGKMTWPHDMAKILLIEQLYRTLTIFASHPYHKQ